MKSISRQTENLSPKREKKLAVGQYTYRNDQQVQEVPSAFEVGPFECLDLYGFLNDVVKDEEHKDALTRQHKEVIWGNITQQFNCSELPWWNDASSCRKLKHQPKDMKI